MSSAREKCDHHSNHSEDRDNEMPKNESKNFLNLRQRPRRNRRSAVLRDLISETHLKPQDFVFPLFIVSGQKQKVPIASLPGLFRYSTDVLVKEMKEWWSLGIKSFALFPVIENDLKDQIARESVNPRGLLPETIRAIKKAFPEALLFSDVAMDPYSSDGHDGFVQNGKILNDPTLEILAKMALNQAEAGADFVSPSDMMDGRVGHIRNALDQAGFQDVGIMSYAAKYASSFYGPFRDALDSAPKFGDKKTYQMDYRNSKEALREVKLDLQEGADMVMVKPALAYLDVIHNVKKISSVPVAAYNVSGEYAMIKFAAEKGVLEEQKAMIESLTAIKRAGADVIFSYFALQFAKSSRF